MRSAGVGFQSKARRRFSAPPLHPVFPQESSFSSACPQVADAGCLCTRDPLPLSIAAAAGTSTRQPSSAVTEEERQILVGLLAGGLQVRRGGVEKTAG